MFDTVDIPYTFDVSLQNDIVYVLLIVHIEHLDSFVELLAT